MKGLISAFVFFLTSFLFAGLAFASDNAIPADPAVWQQIVDFVFSLLPASIANPLISVLLVVAALRFVFKPVMLVLENFASQTETKRDDEILAAIKSSKIYSVIVFLADFLGSIKLPKKKEKK